MKKRDKGRRSGKIILVTAFAILFVLILGMLIFQGELRNMLSEYWDNIGGGCVSALPYAE